MNRILIKVLNGLALLLPIPAHADWSIVGLGPLFGAYSNATAINDSGQIVGWGSTEDGVFNRHALITGKNGVGKTDLGTLGEGESFAYDINNAGQVTGYSFLDKQEEISRAFITDQNGKIVDLGTFGGQYSTGLSINNSGQVVVMSTIPNGSTGQDSLFITGQSGIGVKELGLSGGGGTFWPSRFGINDSGQVVGSFHGQAFFSGPDGLGINIIDYSSIINNMESSYGMDINNYGQVVGFANNNFIAYGFITDTNGENLTNLGDFIPEAINNSSEIVGGSKIYSHGGFTDLELLAPVIADGWTDIQLNDINNNGQMVGYGRHHGIYEALLISYTPDTVFHPTPIVIPPIPIPEPETYAMLLVGLGLVGFMARRRKLNG